MDEPWDDWEVAADAGLEPKPGRLTDDHEKNKQIWQEANAFAQPEIIRTDSTRTEYVPQLHILRRPKNPGSTTTTHPSHLLSLNSGADNANGAQTKKSFADREAEYMVARQKIFGETSVAEFKITNDSKKDDVRKENVVDSQSDEVHVSEGLHLQKVEILRQPRPPSHGSLSGFNRGAQN